MDRQLYTFNLDYDLIYRLHVDYLDKKEILDCEFQRFSNCYGPLEGKKVAIWGGGFGGHIVYAHVKDQCDQIILIDQNPIMVENQFTRIQVVSPKEYFEIEPFCDFIILATHPKHYSAIVELISGFSDKINHICFLYNNPFFYKRHFLERKRVVLSTLPKSGTSWLNLMLKDILLKYKGYRYKEDRKLNDMQYEMYFTNHLPAADILPFIGNTENRFIFLYRDLRDHIISWIHHYKYRKNNIDYKLSQYMDCLDFEEALIEFIVGEPNSKGYGTAAITPVRRTCRMVNEWLQLEAENQNVLTVTYEDLHKNCLGELRRIVNFIGIRVDDEILSKVVKNRSFMRMSQGRRQGDEDKSNHFRKGIVGDWKNYFSPMTKDLFKKMAGDFLVKTGYEPDDSW